MYFPNLTIPSNDVCFERDYSNLVHTFIWFSIFDWSIFSSSKRKKKLLNRFVFLCKLVSYSEVLGPLDYRNFYLSVIQKCSLIVDFWAQCINFNELYQNLKSCLSLRVSVLKRFHCNLFYLFYLLHSYIFNNAINHFFNQLSTYLFTYKYIIVAVNSKM